MVSQSVMIGICGTRLTTTNAKKQRPCKIGNLQLSMCAAVELQTGGQLVSDSRARLVEQWTLGVQVDGRVGVVRRGEVHL